MADLSMPKTPTPTPRWIGWWFRAAALYGTAAILLSLATPPPGDPLFFRAFAGTALAFQIAFWIVGGAPVRYRPLMLAGVAEKLGLVVPAMLAGAGGQLLLAAAIDAVLGAGFLLAWFATPRR